VELPDQMPTDDVGRLMELAVVDHARLAASVAHRVVALLGGVGVVWSLSTDHRLLRVVAVAADSPAITARLQSLVGAPVAATAAQVVSEALLTGRPVNGVAELAAIVPLNRAELDRAELDRTQLDRAEPGLPELERAGAGPAMAVPVLVGGQVVGALAAFAGRRAPGFGAPETDLLERLATRAASALEQVRERSHHARQAEHARILIAWSQAAALPHGPGTAAVRDLTEAAAAVIRGRCWLVSPDDDVIGGVPPEPLGTGPYGRPADQPANLLWWPLRTPTRDFGRLGAEREVPFDEEDASFLAALALQIAMAWESQEAARERDAAVAALRLSEERLRLAFDEAPVGMALIRLAGRRVGSIIRSNQAFRDLSGLTEQGLRRIRIGDLAHPDDHDLERHRLAEFVRGDRLDEEREKRLLRPDGTVVWVQTRLSAIHRDGHPWYAVLHAQDITARKAAIEQLQHQALHDPLTGLANRNRLLDHLELELARLDHEPGVVAVLFLDVDRFKAINDTRGHGAGDTVLRVVAERIRAEVPAPSTVARIAGDEFVVTARVTDEADAEGLAERIQQSLERPVELSGEQLSISASMGVATNRSSSSSPAELIRQADLAMYHAKHDARRDAGPHGVRRWHVYHAALGERAGHRERSLRLLQSAPDAGWLRLMFQPIVDLGTGRVVAAEALLRVAHPELGLLTPDGFINVAETHDVILPIGQWVLTEALQQMREWWPRYRLELGVNVSARQVARRVVGAQIQAAAAAAGYGSRDPLEGLRLEVTERVALEADDDVVADLRRLTDQGIRLSLDDFGTGYASLLHVRRLPVDELKIDGSFVAGLGTDPDDTAIIRGVSALAASLALGTVAEGVERAHQPPLLHELGCRRAQGYLLGAPMDARELERLLDARGPASDQPSGAVNGRLARTAVPAPSIQPDSQPATPASSSRPG
jgi:diguanylate cyclase (GGDEF)-like protein/PAS domain S-box-containing protein